MFYILDFISQEKEYEHINVSWINYKIRDVIDKLILCCLIE